MDYETFKTELLETLQRTAGEKKKVSLRRIEKNNGVFLDGLIIQREGENMAPTFYLEELYQAWEEEVTIEKVAEEILAFAKLQKPETEISVKDFEDYERARNRIYYKLINYKMNQKRLEKMPHIKYLDLAIVFYYRVEGGRLHGATVLIHNNNLDTWGITRGRLLEDAVHNTSRKLPYTFQGMEALIAGLMGESPEIPMGEELMYVLTNKEKCFGAAVILYPHVLSHIAGLLQGNFYILPSSVHECILVPDRGQYSRLELKKMVKEVNEKQVEAEEILSDEVYYYDRKKAVLMM